MESAVRDRVLAILSYVLLAAAAVIIVGVLLTDSTDRDSSTWGFLAMVFGFAAAGVGYWRQKARVQAPRSER